jgi:hypothetical protein
VWAGEVSTISLAVVWSEPSDDRGGPAILLVFSARCEAALPRYHRRSTGKGRHWENDWQCRTIDTILDKTELIKTSVESKKAVSDTRDLRSLTVGGGRNSPTMWGLGGSVAYQLPRSNASLQASQVGSFLHRNLTHGTGVTRRIQSSIPW